MGGKFSVLGVNIENTARHPSTIGVAVNVGKGGMGPNTERGRKEKAKQAIYPKVKFIK